LMIGATANHSNIAGNQLFSLAFEISAHVECVCVDSLSKKWFCSRRCCFGDDNNDSKDTVSASRDWHECILKTRFGDHSSSTIYLGGAPWRQT
jgi:hypothetical protein